MTFWRLILMAAVTAGIAIAPLADAVAKLNAKTPIGARLRSAEWENVPLALRERGQWSANVESVKLLAALQDKLTKRVGLLREQVANGEAGVDRSSFIADIRALAVAEGVQTTGKAGAGTVRDIRSSARLGLIFDQQTRSAAEFATWKTGQDADVLDAFPCQELIRVEERQVPRQWASRWQAAGGKFYEGRMIARKDSPVWTKISRFGTPWPPFDFGSGMGVADVDRDEAERLGVITPADRVPPTEGDFNAELQASVTGLPHEQIENLEQVFGDQIQVTRDAIRWRQPSRPYKTAADMGLPKAGTWTNLPDAPELMPFDAGMDELRAGTTVRSPEGREVRFDLETYEHWQGKPNKDKDMRVRALSWAKETVRNPIERWTQDMQNTFIAAFRKNTGKYSGCVVAVRADGGVHTYFVNNMRDLDRNRHGLNVKVYGREEERS